MRGLVGFFLLAVKAGLDTTHAADGLYDGLTYAIYINRGVSLPCGQMGSQGRV